MYFVKNGNSYLHDPRNESYSLFDLSFDGEKNSCGFCDFTIYPNHPLYNELRERDADNPIEVYDDKDLLFSGFIYELGKEFYLEGHVKCKGDLDYLSESIIRPYSTEERSYGSKAPNTVNKYFEWLIQQHNQQVSPNKRFVVGINQGQLLYSDNIIFVENNTYVKTIEEITKNLLDEFGGYLRVRKENGVRYIDYIYEWTETNHQILDFGVNLTDYTQTDDSSELATFVIPVGARMSETEYEYDDGFFVTPDSEMDPEKQYYTYSDENGYSECDEEMTVFQMDTIYYEYNVLNDESEMPLTIDGPLNTNLMTDYAKYKDQIYCISAVKKYGWIGTVYEDQELVDRNVLARKGILHLKSLVSPKRTIEITAVDMHLVNPELSPIRIGEYVRVRSRPHNLDSYFLCVNISLDLNNPENSTYTLGTTFDTLTGQQNKTITQLNSTINKQQVKTDQISARSTAGATVANRALSKSTEATAIAQTTSTELSTAKEELTVVSGKVDGFENRLNDVGKVLWSSEIGLHMNKMEEAILSENISSQLTGVIFAWSHYINDETTRNEWIYSFVPKSHVILDNGKSVAMANPYFGMNKRLFIYDDKVVGWDPNEVNGTGNNIAFYNDHYVLMYILGV